MTRQRSPDDGHTPAPGPGTIPLARDLSDVTPAAPAPRPRLAGPLGRGLLAVGGVVLTAVSLQHFHFAVESIRATGIVDAPIFIRQAMQFVDTGELYRDVDDLPGNYYPGAPIYKFPPLFGVILIAFVKLGMPGDPYALQWMLQMLLYLLAVALSLWIVAEKRSAALLIVAAILALNFEPFFETLWRLQLETPMLLLLLIALGLFQRGDDAAAGAALGLVTMLKIYPAYVLVYPLLRRRWQTLTGFSLSVAALLLACALFVGVAEVGTYFFTILPYLLGELPVDTPENLGLGKYAQIWLGMGPAAAKGAGQLAGFALLAASTLAVVRNRDLPAPRGLVALEFSMFVSLALLAMPNSWVNYQLLLWMPLVALLAHVFATPRLRLPLSAALVCAWLLTLFYAPCHDPSVDWPCAQTPYWLGLIRLPRGLHDAIVELRMLAALLCWAACWAALVDRKTWRPPVED